MLCLRGPPLPTLAASFFWIGGVFRGCHLNLDMEMSLGNHPPVILGHQREEASVGAQGLPTPSGFGPRAEPPTRPQGCPGRGSPGGA